MVQIERSEFKVERRTLGTKERTDDETLCLIYPIKMKGTTEECSFMKKIEQCSSCKTQVLALICVYS
jgi:hypothetical protein